MNFSKTIIDGFRGFAIFFSIILQLKLFIYLFGFSAGLNIEVIDVYQSLIGFVLFIFIGASQKSAKQT